MTGYRLVSATGWNNAISAGVMVAKMINLGNLNLSTNVFTAGSAMPTITALGTSTQLASFLIIEATTALNSAPGTYTVTYTDQGGTSRTTGSVTPAASAVIYSAAVPLPVANGPGVRAVTAAVRSGGTSPTGTITFWGVIPLGEFIAKGTNSPGVINNTTAGFKLPSLGGGDTVGVWYMGTANATRIFGQLNFVGDS